MGPLRSPAPRVAGRLDGPVSPPSALEAAAAAWRAEGVARVDGVLPAGLAAELLVGLRRLPLTAVEEDGEVVWVYDVGVPPERDPQLFEPLFRLVPLLDQVVPRLAAEVVGRPLAPQAPASFRVVAYRKGSWSRGPRACAPGLIGCTLGLGDDAWPTAWGGQSSPPVRGDQLTLYDPGRAPEVPVLLRHVERFELRTFLTPVAP